MTIKTQDDLEKEIREQDPDWRPTPINETVKGMDIFLPNWIDVRSVESKNQVWFWDNVIPSEDVTLFAGIGGVGKSSLLLGITAATTNGHTVSICGKEILFKKGGVIYMGAEDKVASSIKPKLESMNANFDNFHYIQDLIGDRSKRRIGLSLDSNLGILESKINDVRHDENINNISLVIIDPVTYYLGNVRDHISTEVANFILSLNVLAEKYGIAIVICKHLRKAASGANLTNLINEVGGSSAWINSPRMAWAIYEHPDDPSIKLMSNIKSNVIARDKYAYNYIIKSKKLSNGIEASFVKWGDKMIDIDPNLASNSEAYQNNKLQKAINFIFEYLESRSQCYAKDVQQAGIDDGHTKKTMRNALSTIRLKYKHIVQEDKDGTSIILKMNKYDT